MAEIRRYRRKYRYPIGALGVPGDASALSVEQRAISRFAETVSMFSAAEARRIMKADEEAQTIEGVAEMERQMNLTFDTFDTNNKEDEYLSSYQKTEKGFDQLIKGYSNKNAQKELQLFREKNKPKWENAVNDAVLNRKSINAIDSSGRIIDSINDLDLTDPTARAEAEGRIGAAGNLRRDTGLYSDDAVESWTEEALRNVDNRAIYQQAEKILAIQGYDKAVDFVMEQKIEVSDRNKIISNLSSTERIRAAKHQQIREDTMRTMLSDIWDGKISDPQIVTDAFRAGYLDDTDAKYLRDALLNPEPPKTTNEALISMRYSIDGIAAGTETRESALKKLISYSQQLSPADGKGFIKEIFGEHDTKNAFWNRQAQEYMEKQIMEVASLTGILYGSGEQLALSAQALISYDEAKKAATAEGKPLNGRELLELAHQVMLPFRSKVKPLMKGEKIPYTLGGRKVGAGTKKPRETEKIKLEPKTEEEKNAVIDSYPEPKNEQEFKNTFNHISDKEQRKRYYDKWVDIVYKKAK